MVVRAEDGRDPRVQARGEGDKRRRREWVDGRRRGRRFVVEEVGEIVRAHGVNVDV